MKVQNKPDYLIFASDAKTGELQAFPNISRGWGLTTDQTQSKPPLSWMNGAFNRIDENMLYLLQQGVPQWDSAVLYPIDAIIKYKSQLYVAITENDNVIPSSNTEKWQKLIKDASIEQKGIVQLSSAIDSDSEITAATSKAVRNVIDDLKNNMKWYSKAIGELCTFDPVDIPPTNLPGCRYVRLTVNDSYNDGILTNQIVSGSEPLINATAMINLPNSPLHGKAINLLNTEGRAIVAGTTNGILRDDAIQNIHGYIDGVFNFAEAGGAFQVGNYCPTAHAEVFKNGNHGIDFNISRVARTDTSTHPRDISKIFYMRIL
ncbi:phage tail protein [Orbus wheelerorum]|uniref:phage tail protein n=1 Tax=Orbus wheelerorum TaxID=3074111 RepID=UPI00370DCECE